MDYLHDIMQKKLIQIPIIIIIMMMSIYLLLATALISCNAFRFTQFPLSRRSKIYSSSNEISATSSKELLTATPYSSISRSELNECILKLEKSKSVENPAESPLLNGVWEVVNSGGITSPGMLGYQIVKKFLQGPLDVQAVTVTISSVQPRITAATSIKVGSALVDFVVSAELEVQSGLSFKEKIESAKVGSLDIPLSAAGYSRSLAISYLDDDLLIVRDQYGAPDVLKRAEKAFLASSAEGSPSSTDENGAPGS